MRKELLFVVLLVFTALLFACGCEQAGEDASTEQPLEAEAEDVEAEEAEDELQEEPELEEVAAEIVVTDQVNREVTITGVPGRIISLSPSNTEVAFALGLGDRVVGVTEFCNYPSEAMDKNLVGGFSSPSLEVIVDLEPDLVLASTIHNEEVPRLEDMGIVVLVVESSTLEELYESISLVAEISGVVEAGSELVSSMEERIDAVSRAVAAVDDADRVRAFYEVYSDPLMTAGRGAFINEILTLAGGVNIFGDVDENYPQISAEEVADRQPHVILYPDYHGTADFVLEEMAGRPGWESVPAVVDERLYAISDDTFARPGPRVVEAVEEAARIFYPGLF